MLCVKILGELIMFYQIIKIKTNNVVYNFIVLKKMMQHSSGAVSFQQLNNNTKRERYKCEGPNMIWCFHS